ncbi:MAG: hypothetical protein ACFCUU_16875 [Cyclobacteriaceae bacterium]
MILLPLFPEFLQQSGGNIRNLRAAAGKGKIVIRNEVISVLLSRINFQLSYRQVFFPVLTVVGRCNRLSRTPSLQTKGD